VGNLLESVSVNPFVIHVCGSVCAKSNYKVTTNNMNLQKSEYLSGSETDKRSLFLFERAADLPKPSLGAMASVNT
jgi:hypothetical protein